ncbi:MAG: class I SAM-dependent methyltransferase [Desulfovibrio sp.]|nr:MAG: class I SAM-dependent methyltransferase [Desulfovibrio sp.]
MNTAMDMSNDSTKTRVCPWYMAYTFDNGLRGFFHNPAAILGPYVSPGMTVLDVGCGMGFFSLGMARLVGESGNVYSVDLQDKMLARVKNRAQAKGLDSIIETHRCAEDSIGLDVKVDFALGFWMVHETPDISAFFREMHAMLNPGGHMLVAEPRIHVSRRFVTNEQALAKEAGFSVAAEPKVRLSRAFVLKKDQ